MQADYRGYALVGEAIDEHPLEFISLEDTLVDYIVGYDHQDPDSDQQEEGQEEVEHEHYSDGIAEAAEGEHGYGDQ